MNDLDATIYRAYRFLRRSGNVVLAGQAWMLYRKSKRTTFMVASDGTAWRYNRAALLADLRLLMLRTYPVGFVAKFDR